MPLFFWFDLFLDTRAAFLTKILGFSLSIRRHHKDISKLTDLYCCCFIYFLLFSFKIQSRLNWIKLKLIVSKKIFSTLFFLSLFRNGKLWCSTISEKGQPQKMHLISLKLQYIFFYFFTSRYLLNFKLMGSYFQLYQGGFFRMIELSLI